ncbi:hypothetical protein [uncultured Jatrophihabitans sp.]|uniref:hypothetical protein n=1 Tax=uncultured Jatrophihabitans sp. TaxID=1610747 RepID=UPI0035CBF899
MGAVLALIGAGLGVVAFTAVNWFDCTFNRQDDSTLATIHDVLIKIGATGAAKNIANNYFAWVGWALLAHCNRGADGPAQDLTPAPPR